MPAVFAGPFQLRQVLGHLVVMASVCDGYIATSVSCAAEATAASIDVHWNARHLRKAAIAAAIAFVA
jgi:hypothetical protein